MEKIIESLSPIERKIIPFLNLSIDEIKEKSDLDQTSVLRALRFLENKGFVKIKAKEKTIIQLGTNGIYYAKNHLPERQLLITLEQKNHPPLEEAKKISKLSDNEFRVSLGILKKKALIKLSNGKISLICPKESVVKKFPEESFIETLPISKDELTSEQQSVLKELEKRKNIIELERQKTVSFELTKTGRRIAGKKIESNLLEEVTPEMIKSFSNARPGKFRRYDIQAPVPAINGGKKHFVNQSIEYAKSIWTDMGFEEMTGPLTETSFWNFDALFQPQDHPTRDMHDTFFIEGVAGKLPDSKLVKKVKDAHEKGTNSSKGWRYEWERPDAQKVVLRTHTTTISAKKLAELKKQDLPAKFFAIGKCFRNETVDWSHGFEFYQTEGIVVDKDANFRHLLGYLREFFAKMGFEKIRFTPGYFPYTEPSVEISAFHPGKKCWLELGGAGIFRPEVTIPLLGEDIPVLAWGPGFDRIIMDYYQIKDLRELYANNISVLRNKKPWLK